MVQSAQGGPTALGPGSAAPWFSQQTLSLPNYSFSSAGGRYLALCFLGSAGDDSAREVIQQVLDATDVFDGQRAAFFGVTIDARDKANETLFERNGIRYFLDFDGAVSRLYGAVPRASAPGEQSRYKRMWVLIDPTLRVMGLAPFGQTAALISRLRTLPPPDRCSGIRLQAPILYLPQVFEPAFCKHLINLYESNGGEMSGVMREIDGKTVGVRDLRFKARRDFLLEDAELRRQVDLRIERAIVPEIAKVHQFKATHIERYMVGCYDAADNAHFAPHRDNTTKGTAHRRFAVSINLNDDFDGGEICFPEYGPQSFKPPTGCAVVFSCSLLHAVSLVTRGKRYAFLPFLYDQAAADIRDENRRFISREERSDHAPS
ncbi:2OG-Fe(II) oxygenase [Bradyrhizobium sp. 2S1]|uniref:2OG-Fe(II) oxygenase n=1 Tax=Bradyrhizobium sp. 2S1 TaxID=1404429 RepID=UPI00140A2EC2|nr:2OG-Fe(II) oxygenase [Bradyrhizobium sp. 2S1]MCK7669767.1 2OG-Fe(II) oxygenase [Bradyrhizobium sp. 2S1]